MPCAAIGPPVAYCAIRQPRLYHFPADRPTLRGVLHRHAAAVFAVVFLAILVACPDWAGRAWVAFHALGITTMLAVSGGYHTADVSPQTRHLLRRLDHSAILLAIAGSYTGIAGLCLDGSHRTLWLAVIWAAALAGIALRMLVFDGLHPMLAASYIGISWVVVVDAPTLGRALDDAQLVLLILGGVLYTAGAIVLGLRRPNPWPRIFGYHEVFHALVVAAAACHVAVTASLVAQRRSG